MPEAQTTAAAPLPPTLNESPSRRGPITVVPRRIGNGVAVPSITTQDIADWLGEPDTNHRILRSYDLSIANRGPEFIRAHFLAVRKDGTPATSGKRRAVVIMDSIGADCVLGWMLGHKTAFPPYVYQEARHSFAQAFTEYRMNSAPLLSGEPPMQPPLIPEPEAKEESPILTESPQPCSRPLVPVREEFKPVSPNVVEVAELTAFLRGNGYAKADSVLAAMLAVYGDFPTLRGLLSEGHA